MYVIWLLYECNFQLIADKKTLNAQCDRLVADLKTAEQRYAHNMQAAEQRHSLEVQRTRDKLLAAEKLRRDRWVETHSKKIKVLFFKHNEYGEYHYLKETQKQLH